MPSLPDAVTVRAAAKVNLELLVGPRDASGYHALATVFQAVSLYDDVTVRRAGRCSLTVAGRDAEHVPTDESNLAWRAVVAVGEGHPDAGPVAISIAKDIPVAGGMAGGSADGAAALVAADALWGVGLGRSELHRLAAGLGADVPFSVLGGTAIGTGRGDELAPAMARGSYHWVFAFSDEGLSTPRVFAELDRLRAERGEEAVHQPEPEVSPALMTALLAGDAEAVGRAMHNDLQEAALSLQPRLADTLVIGQECGALGGIVSGSGPTCAFLAASHEHALDLAVALTASGVASDVRRAQGPVPGARLIHPGKEQ
ncbi:4-(cytidine 5'-diphospho)-2-C-methyl-D-erythritol kinase [Arsenicicoccus sp. MKL-02]|uniref:4-diphosphocytidyl-2-C-methyl-D-erythritol kinase n=1 Tax=Arsenicicoccus cauae TaxID=2663847 RepID=A0A6I3I778_9MICO|nr:4-(cytidine 5'-diphospho)-2-C-methyl-D-erythritol kinase [Arsenicicoccus cauae]MTB72024.1 4-(cytidine 5'-diphospho)-2-C-methyl-D-erythritol kinase [Arsenicicoccus cauae]